MHKPPAVHLCVTLRHTQPGVADRFLTDLEAAVQQVKTQPGVTLADVQPAVTSVIEHELALLPDFTGRLARGKLPVW